MLAINPMGVEKPISRVDTEKGEAKAQAGSPDYTTTTACYLRNLNEARAALRVCLTVSESKLFTVPGL